MSKELKPCPFCGGVAVVRQTRLLGGFTVCCINNDCGVKPSTDRWFAIQLAIDEWNKRALEEER
jgi:ssDNA-binding Zn-finger/Zn-ribbon topoisomerase 1